MPAIGEVTISLYWGTLYDTINVPLRNNQIIADATRTETYTGQMVWQTTWLSGVRLNIDNYQSIVGCQYARIVDTGIGPAVAHWYQVLTYEQISQGCVELGLRYDTILSIPPGTYDKVTGILRRWTVDEDGPYRYLNTPEPIDLAEPLAITWQIIQPVASASVTEEIAGFPYDMSQLPEVITYENPNGEETNVYYPKLESAMKNGKMTTFLSGLNPAGSSGAINFTDGMAYYSWGNATPADVYNAAISLGIDIVVNGYILPDASWFNLDKGGDGWYNIISGTQRNYTGTLPLYISSLKNAKAGALNTTFTLASVGSGDSVIVNNFQLQNTNILVFTDPYSTGGFRARFSSYLSDTSQLNGFVKSGSWQPLTITSGVGFGTTSTTIANIMSADTIALQNAQQQWTAAREVAGVYRDSQLKSFDIWAESSISLLGSVASAVDTNNSNLAGAITTPMYAAIQQNDNQYQTGRRIREIQLAAEQADARAQHQLQMLSYKGNAGRLAPPNVKYAMASDISRLTYAFSVMAARPSTRDMQRLDDFFTAFGYNVDGALLTDGAQLKCRDKFVFVQADHVRIESLTTTSSIERVADLQTTQDIERRFAAGLRIWATTPDFDYSKANPIKQEITS